MNVIGNPLWVAGSSLELDESFREAGAEVVGVDFGREVWQHGTTGAAVPHGAV